MDRLAEQRSSQGFISHTTKQAEKQQLVTTIPIFHQAFFYVHLTPLFLGGDDDDDDEDDDDDDDDDDDE